MDQRRYNQFCAAARTLDIVGERWTLLLVRELLTGPKRYGDLQRSQRGLGTGLLAARLKHLEREGLVRRVTLPAPAGASGYALTEAGRDLGSAVLALSQWGMKWAMDERRAEESFEPGWALLGMQACFDPGAAAAAGVHGVYEFRVGSEVLHARVEAGSVETVQGPAPCPDVTVAFDGDDAFLDVTMGRLSLAAALTDGSATVTGDRQALHDLGKVFRLPRPTGATARRAAGAV